MCREDSNRKFASLSVLLKAGVQPTSKAEIHTGNRSVIVPPHACGFSRSVQPFDDLRAPDCTCVPAWSQETCCQARQRRVSSGLALVMCHM